MPAGQLRRVNWNGVTLGVILVLNSLFCTDGRVTFVPSAKQDSVLTVTGGTVKYLVVAVPVLR
ncbi:hypothetical protein D3C84_1256720 [compost metagenome]